MWCYSQFLHSSKDFGEHGRNSELARVFVGSGSSLSYLRFLCNYSPMGHARIPYPPTQVDNTKVGVLQFLVAAEVIVLEPNDVCGATAPFFSPQRLSVDMDECFL